ncbi:DUF2326 domain-containing protein [Salipaludibacillus sp. HK11]|uniref:DUF2326 domain-containing protein n=1 Tax=Salipaludibacillus sp. HK11 TaxID=3394320 RepID=UPI0039FC89E9
MAFKDKGKIRPPITFKPGLNVVLGGENGENSIGKSSALLAIDFIFGGSTYIKTDAVKQVGHHTLYFCFEFEGTSYYFARNTKYPETIHICDKDYKVTDENYSLDEFVSWLKGKYGLDFRDLKFRNTVGRFFRIYGKQNYDEKQPLKIRHQEGMEKAIDTTIKLFDRFKFTEPYKQNLNIQTELQQTFRNARKYQFIPSLVDGKTKYDTSVAKIESLKQTREQLSQESNNDFSEEQIKRENQRLDLKNEVYRLNKKIQQNKSKISLLEINLETGLYPTEADFKSLMTYFPNVNLRRIHEVEGFHQKLAIILNDEFAQERESLESENQELKVIVNGMEIQMSELGIPTQLSPEFLDEYSRLSRKIHELEAQNDAYTKLNKLNEKKRRAKQALEQSIESILSEIEAEINTEMKELNSRMLNENRKAPLLKLKAYNSYSFFTPDDDGTGTNYKGLVLFDLATLRLSMLPAITHDSLIFKNIEDESVDGIMQLYNDIEKQIFISFDRASSYESSTAKIAYDNTRLTLGKNGQELYGEDWKLEENNDASKL